MGLRSGAGHFPSRQRLRQFISAWQGPILVFLLAKMSCHPITWCDMLLGLRSSPGNVGDVYARRKLRLFIICNLLDMNEECPKQHTGVDLIGDSKLFHLYSTPLD
jgi:hypothetical protein